MSEDYPGQSPLPTQPHCSAGENSPHHAQHAVFPLGQHILPIVLIGGLVFLLRIATTSTVTGEVVPIPGEHLLETVVGYAVLMSELFAAAVITIAAIQGLVLYLRNNFLHKSLNCQISDMESNRLRMGHRLSLGLEFAIAADILRLAISPRVNDLIVVFAIILLRILLNYFLEQDGHSIRVNRYIQNLEEGDKPTLPPAHVDDHC